MEKVFNEGQHKGYEIGEIEIHGKIHEDDYWFVTIRPLKIFGDRLCKKTCAEPEIARYVHMRIAKDLNICEKLINEIIPFT